MESPRQYFSLKRNFRILLPSSERATHLSAIDGFRAIAILWVVGFHLLLYVGNFDIPTFLSIRNEIAVRWLRWGFHGVDIFFVVSGFIISHMLLTEWEKHGHISIKHFYIRRVLRLLPAYYVVLAIYAFVDNGALPYVWANILYVNNMLPAEHLYMPWSWSLAIEEQFYIIFPFLLLILLRLKRGKILSALLLVLAAFAIRFYVTFTHDIPIPPPHPFMDFAKFSVFYETIYAGLHVRFGALAMGVLIALIYHSGSGKKLLERYAILRITLLLLSLCLLVPALVANEAAVTGDQLAFKSIFAAYPYLFAAAIAYIILYSLTEKGRRSPIGKFLYSRCWYPIAQLSYSMYLIHPIIILVFYKYMYHPAGQSLAAITASWLIVFPLIILASAALYLLVERPIMNMRKAYQEVN
jgi:peptidoglycan/LPS O-acetylase OafA/YrhL